MNWPYFSEYGQNCSKNGRIYSKLAVFIVNWPYKVRGALMSVRDNKMAVLRQLGLESESIGLPGLMVRLGKDFKERSVRRWLDLLVEEGVVKKIGQKRGTKYIVAGRSEEVKNGISSCFSSASLKVIEFVKRPLFERQPVAYAEEWFDNYQPNSSYYALMVCSKGDARPFGVMSSPLSYSLRS